MQVYTVYIDVVLIINFIMDYLILWATAKVMNISYKKKQIAIGAALGSLYSLVVLFPYLSILMTVGLKFVFSIIIVLVSFYPLCFKEFIRGVICFYFITFACAGAMLATVFFVRNYPITEINGILTGFGNLNYSFLTAAMGSAIAVGIVGVKIIKKDIKNIMYFPIVVRLEKKSFTAKALVDTGNNLRDPFSGKPVVVLEWKIIKEILPSEVQKLFEDNCELDIKKIAEELSRTSLASRVRIIPFTSIGKIKGMLLGIRPDEVLVIDKKGFFRVNNVIIGLYNKKLSPQGNYNALLHPDVVRNILVS